VNQRENEPDSGDGQPDLIEPIKFRPASGAPQLPRVKLPWTHGFIALILIVGLWGAWYVVTARSVSIVTDPPEATVTVDELVAPSIGGHWVLRAGARSITVEAPGYVAFRDDLMITDEPIQIHTVKLTPLPGQLRVEVTPVKTARIAIDDLIEAAVPATVSNIEAGAREITITADRYIDFSTVIEIKGRGIEQLLQVNLKPAWADVSIQSHPAGAAVRFDTQTVGTTPLDAELLQGERVVELSLDGYKPWKRTLQVTAGTPVELPPVHLSKADGYVEVITAPSGASITVDSNFKGQSPIKFAVSPDKKHKISALKEGYNVAAQTVSVGSSKTENITLQLKPELAAVQVISSPANAQLFVDGQPRGSANQTIQLPTHAHEIEIRLPGHVSYSGSLTPRKGIRKRLKVRLKTPTEAAASATKAAQRKGNASQGTITTSVNQSLKFFRGGNVTMGSSRRDAGRRADEVLREVKLVRPFYFGVKEVTNGEFRRFLANHRVPPINGIDVDSDSHPVVSVGWENAAVFCNWLSRKDSLDVFYQIKNGTVLGINPTALGYRLPTEAEWSWVARTAPKGKESFDFPWAGKFPPRGRSGNYADQSASSILGQVIGDYNDGFQVTAPVGSFSANLRGIYDLGGNVSEWINDYYSPTAGQNSGVEQDPLGPRSGEARVIRGSNWAHATVTELRLAYRDFGYAGRDDVGFRIARYAQ